MKGSASDRRVDSIEVRCGGLGLGSRCHSVAGSRVSCWLVVVYLDVCGATDEDHGMCQDLPRRYRTNEGPTL